MQATKLAKQCEGWTVDLADQATTENPVLLATHLGNWIILQNTVILISFTR